MDHDRDMGTSAVPKGNPTFIIKVQYHEHANWHGYIQWVEGKQIKPFRSVMEMLKLMEEAAQRMEEEPSQPLESWD